MANIEKQRLAKQEAAMASEEFELPAAPEPPKKTRKPRAKKVVEPEPEPQPETKVIPEVKEEPKQEEPVVIPDDEPKAKLPFEFDEDKFAEKVAAKLKESYSVMLPPLPKLVTTRRKTTKPKAAKAVKVPDQEDAIPAFNNFSWL